MFKKEEKTLAIIIPVFNNYLYTNKTLKYLSYLPKDHLIIIVDNGSTDKTKELNTSFNYFVIHNSENLGFAKACNIGYAKAVELGYENVMFLNNDIKVIDNYSNWTEALIKRAKEGIIVGPTVGVLDTNLNFVCEVSKWPTKGFGYLSGWNITSSVNIWNKLISEGEIGPFSSDFGLAYFEDPDLCFRANDIGVKFEVIQVPVKHYGKATSKNIGLSALYQHAKPIFMNKWKGKII